MSLNLQQEKENLKKKLSEYTNDLKTQRKAIEDDVKEYRNQIKEKYQGSLEYVEKGKYVALGLGALFLIYKMISWVWSSPEPKDEDEDGPKVVVINSKESSIVKKIKEAIASFIISIAKKELERILKKLKEKKKASSTAS